MKPEDWISFSECEPEPGEDILIFFHKHKFVRRDPGSINWPLDATHWQPWADPVDPFEQWWSKRKHDAEFGGADKAVARAAWNAAKEASDK